MRALKPSLVHVHDGRGLLPAAMAAKLAGRLPVVVSRRVAFPARVALGRRLKYVFAADKVIATSQYIRDRLVKEGLPSSRLAVIRDGVDLKRYGPVRLRNRSGLCGANDCVTVGTLAALSPEKGMSILIDAAAILEQQRVPVRFLIAGEGTERSWLESLVTARGLSRVIELLGQVQDVPGYLAHLDIFVHPALQEGLGSAILEAMAMGLPVVATEAGGIPETVINAHTGLLVPPRDPVRLAQAVRRMVDGRAEAEGMGWAGRIRVEGFFSSDRMVDETLALYTDLMNGRA